MRSRDIVRLARRTYWAARALGLSHTSAVHATAEEVRPYGAWVVDGHPVPYAATVWRDPAWRPRPLGYVGEGVER